ncbi:MAG: CHAP domain-containing protein, partial [Erythrobacter sp.]
MLLRRFHIIAAAILAAISSLFLAPTAAMAANIQCVPFAREASGIQIYGDAHTWWKQAAGKYARGNRPVKGAVMAFKPYRNSRLGHVAVVSKVVNSRKVM